MTFKHIVRQGDHAARIAATSGFRDLRTVWRHADNAVLAAERSPHVLAPGDVVVVPDKDVRQEPAATNARHVFYASRTKLRLRVALRDFRDKPLAGTEVKLNVEAKLEADLVSDGDGMIDTEIMPLDSSGTIEVTEGSAELWIGGLVPVSLDEGVRARLDNLGYLLTDATGPEGEDELRLAIEESQIDAGLPVTGGADDATRAALIQMHGC